MLRPRQLPDVHLRLRSDRQRQDVHNGGPPENAGVIHRSVAHIFRAVDDMRPIGRTFALRVRSIEIYNDPILDLLGSSTTPKKLRSATSRARSQSPKPSRQPSPPPTRSPRSSASQRRTGPSRRPAATSTCPAPTASSSWTSSGPTRPPARSATAGRRSSTSPGASASARVAS